MLHSDHTPKAKEVRQWKLGFVLRPLFAKSILYRGEKVIDLTIDKKGKCDINELLGATNYPLNKLTAKENK